MLTPSSPKPVLSLGASTQAADCYPEERSCSPKDHQENDQGPMRRRLTYISPKELRQEGGLGIHWTLGCMHLRSITVSRLGQPGCSFPARQQVAPASSGGGWSGLAGLSPDWLGFSAPHPHMIPWPQMQFSVPHLLSLLRIILPAVPWLSSKPI